MDYEGFSVIWKPGAGESMSKDYFKRPIGQMTRV